MTAVPLRSLQPPTSQLCMWVRRKQRVTGTQRTSTLLLRVPLEEPLPLPTREAGSSGGLEPAAGPTGLDRWLGFCSHRPAAFFL